MSPSIVVAEDELITRLDLVEILESGGYQVLGQAKDGLDAIDLCRKYLPDIVMIDIKMPILNGLDALKVIKEEKLAKCFIVLTAYDDRAYINKAKELGVTNYILKPFAEKDILPAVEIAFGKQLELETIQDELANMTKKLEDRKYIEKAKGKLMKEHKVSEEQAYKMLRKLAMDKRKSMSELAKILVGK